MGIRRKPVTIELDGRERTLKYDLNALCLFEEQAGIGITEALTKPRMSSIRALLWAGLIHEDALLTVDDVGRMAFGSLGEVMRTCMLAFNADTAAPESRPTAAPEIAAASPTGASSGASDDTISVLAMANSGA